MANKHPHDYDLNEKIQINFEGMDYWIMPRYKQHYLNEDYERFSLKIVGSYLGSGKTMLDIGAHYGAYSIYAAAKTGASVISIEPVKENFDLLTRNIKANKLDSLVTAHNVAASDEDGTAEFNIPWASDSAGFYKHPLAETIKTQQVTVKKIDNLTAGQKIDFIKIDTEGHEVHVLDGLAHILKENPEIVMLIEANPPTLKAAGQNMENLMNKIESFNKEIYVVDDQNFTLARLSGRKDRWTEFIGHEGYANLLCVPKKGHKYAMFICHSTELGGAEMAMIEQIEALRKNNYLAHIVLPNDGEIRNLIEDKGISYSVSSYSFWQLPEKSSPEEYNRQNIEAAAGIADLATRLGPDLVINNTIVCPWGLYAAKSLGLPLVWMIHEYGDLDHHVRFLHDIDQIRKFIVEESDLVICCSESVKKIMKAAKPSHKIYAIYNILDSEEIQQKAESKVKSAIFPTNSPKLIMVGRIKAEKGQMLAVQALAKLKQDNIKPQLLIIGPGEATYIKKLKVEVNSLGLSGQIRILDFLPNPLPAIKAADALLTCSLNEAFGRGTAEAMILGKPVIGSNSGGTSEMVVNGKTGLLFKPGDTDDLARAIKEMLKKYNLSKLGENGRQHISKMLDKDKLSEKLTKTLADIEYGKDRSVSKLMYQETVNAVRSETNLRIDLQGELSKIKDKDSARIAELEHKISLLQNEINKLINSNSWKITKPARLVSRSVRRRKDKN